MYCCHQFDPPNQRDIPTWCARYNFLPIGRWRMYRLRHILHPVLSWLQYCQKFLLQYLFWEILFKSKSESKFSSFILGIISLLQSSIPSGKKAIRNSYQKQKRIPVGCVPSARPPYVLQKPPDVSIWGYGPTSPPRRQNDRCLWKHYFPTTWRAVITLLSITRRMTSVRLQLNWRKRPAFGK